MKCCSDSSQFSAKSVILPEQRPAEYNCDFHIILAEPMEGLHLTADCFDCQCPIELLLSPAPLQKLLTELTLKAGLTMVGERFFPFTHEDGSAAGITGTLLLAESHLAIHTWPERRAITLDLYVCNFNNDNSEKARQIVNKILNIFQPKEVCRQELRRGVPDAHLPKQQLKLIEHLSPTSSMQFTAENLVAEQQSEFQHIQIFETPEFGKCMRIDEAMMTTEKDEFLYHEALVHPAALSLKNLQKVLIIGGGDGGSSEEVLKYRSVEKVSLCEIDPEVISLAKKHLTSIHRRAFDDPRLQIHFADGFAFVQNSEENYDLILLDLTDPIAPNGSNLAQSCFGLEFFEDCYRALGSHGALVLHLGSKFYHAERYQYTLNKLQSVFERVRPFANFIPSYGALWSFAVALKGQEALDEIDPFLQNETSIDESLRVNDIQGLQYYDGARHVAMFRI